MPRAASTATQAQPCPQVQAPAGQRGARWPQRLAGRQLSPVATPLRPGGPQEPDSAFQEPGPAAVCLFLLIQKRKRERELRIGF